jgi:hypothetical protein
MSDFDVGHRDWSESLAAARAAGGAGLILTSPPYPDARTVEQYGGAEFDTTLEGYGRLGEACFDALKPGGVCALNIDGPIRVWRPELGESERSLIAFEVAIDWAKRVGFRYVEHVAKAVDGFPVSGDGCNPRWRAGWEPVHVFARPGAVPLFDRHGYTRVAKYAGTTTSSTARRLGEKRQSAMKPALVSERRCLMTCERWLSQHSESHHSAPFPSDFADAFVLCYSEPGSLVCDPFAGSGTVAFSCHRHGRRFVGGDLGHRERDGRRWADVIADGLRQERLFPVEVSP